MVKEKRVRLCRLSRLRATQKTRTGSTKCAIVSSLCKIRCNRDNYVHRLLVVASSDGDTIVQGLLMKLSDAIVKAKVQFLLLIVLQIKSGLPEQSDYLSTLNLVQNACAFSLGFGEDSINASAVLVMPMVSSKITGFRGSGFERSGWTKISTTDHAVPHSP